MSGRILIRTSIIALIFILQIGVCFSDCEEEVGRYVNSENEAFRLLKNAVYAFVTNPASTTVTLQELSTLAGFYFENMGADVDAADICNRVDGVNDTIISIGNKVYYGERDDNPDETIITVRDEAGREHILLIDNIRNHCGNGFKEGFEACDDGNNDDSDGCDAACGVEPDYVCFGQPSVCVKATFNVQDALIVYDSGDITITGEIFADQAAMPEILPAQNVFVMIDDNDVPVMILNIDTGDMYLKGSFNDNEASILPTGLNDFIIINNAGENVGLIDNSGNFYITGTVVS